MTALRWAVTDAWTGAGRDAAHWRRQPAPLLVNALFPVLLLLMFVYLLGGGAYVMIALMALTSNDAAQRAMGHRNWKLLHAVGGWWVLVIFTNSYVSRLMEKPAIAGPAVALIAVALTLRIAAALKGRMRAQAA